MRKIQQVVVHLTLAVFLCDILLQASLYSAKPIDEDCNTFCQSPVCLRHAGMMVKKINPQIDPCEDFYSFACGGYMAKFGENDTRSTYDDAWHSLQLQIKDLIENLDEGVISRKLKTVYENCVNIGSIERNAVSDAANFFRQVGIPNWPDLNQDFQFTKLSKTLANLAVYGEFAFISFKPTPYDKKNSALSPALILPGNFLLNSQSKLKDIHTSVLRILNYLNVGENETNIMWKTFKEVEDIGIQLQNEETGNSQGCRGSPKNMYTEVNCSEETHGSLKLLCNIWKSAVKNRLIQGYYSPDIIHISCRWNHFHYIENILLYLNKANHKSLADYLSLRFFFSHMHDLNIYFNMTKKTYHGGKDHASKISEPISRWEYCVGWIIKSMDLALGYEYSQKIVTKSVENNVLHIIKDYAHELNSSIQNMNWLNKRIKMYLQKQLEKLDIGFKTTMDGYRDKISVKKYYNEFHPSKGSFLKNILEYQRMSIVKEDKTIFNSFYSSSDPDAMDFGFALLQPPTFSYGLPKIWNYATLGFAIGHELSHNLKFFFDFVHLDDKTENILTRKLQCYTEQYSHFIMNRTGKMMNSKETEEEVFADNIGWTLTEQIIENIFHETIPLALPGLEYTSKQIVYISFVQDSCAALSKSVEADFYASKPQNLQKLRVLGVLRNSKIFSQTFNCLKGSFMNPESKCTFF